MTELDTRQYWNDMAELRAATPLVAGLASTVKTCGVSFSGSDASYMARCPSPWLSYASSATPSASQAELVFPRAYFDWCRRYIGKALQYRPRGTASSEFRVCWALDVWSHLNYARFALNLPWADIYPVPAHATMITELLPLGHPFFTAGSGPSSISWSQNEQVAFEEAKARESSRATTRLSQDQVDDAKLCPSPFSQLAIRWCAATTPRDVHFQKTNPVWKLLLKAVQPWNMAWGDNWLASKDNKDSAEFAQADEVRRYFLLQWRLWSVQDFGYRGPDPRWWPLSMGTADNCATLGRYIAAVRGEGTVPKIVFIVARAYPNLAFGLDAVETMARGFTAGPSYDKIISEHLAWWFTRYAPQVAGDGTPVGRLPVTYTDMSNFINGISTAASARAIAAGKNPAAACRPDDKACLKAATYAAQVQAAIQKSPLGGIWSALNSVRAAIMAQVGGAVGGGSSPFYVLRNPFARTLSTPGWGLVANGSTFDLGTRLVEAVSNYTRLLPGLFDAGSATTYQPTKVCVTWFTRADVPCVVCDGEPEPACVEDVHAYVHRAVVSDPYGLSAVLPILKLYDAWARANPEQAQCIGPVGKRRYVELAAEVLAGKRTRQSADAVWSQLGAACVVYKRLADQRARKSVWSAFKSGFLRAGNPLG